MVLRYSSRAIRRSSSSSALVIMVSGFPGNRGSGGRVASTSIILDKPRIIPWKCSFPEIVRCLRVSQIWLNFHLLYNKRITLEDWIIWLNNLKICSSRHKLVGRFNAELSIYLWRKLGSCVKKWSSGTSSLRSNSTNHAQLGSEQKLNRVKSKLAFAKFNYIYQELSEFKQKGTQEVYFQAITKYSFAWMVAKRTKKPS